MCGCALAHVRCSRSKGTLQIAQAASISSPPSPQPNILGDLAPIFQESVVVLVNDCCTCRDLQAGGHRGDGAQQMHLVSSAAACSNRVQLVVLPLQSAAL